MDKIHFHQITSFNRYMVECELSRGYYRKRSEAVLIDTWWNVNDKRKQPGYWLGKVLIDTWWNVNIIMSLLSSLSSLFL